MGWRPFVLISVLLWFSTVAWANGTGGQLIATTGQVWTQAPGADEIRAQVGTRLSPGTRIRTGPQGQAEVLLDDGSTLIVQNDTAMVLSGVKRQKQKKTSLLVFFGRIWNKVSKAIGPQTRYEVSTPVVVAGVRGTAFEAAVGDDGSVRIRVASGEVEVTENDYQDTVASGQEVEADVEGVGKTVSAEKDPDWVKWRQQRREKLRTEGRRLADAYKSRILKRKAELEDLRAQQQAIEAKRKDAIERAKQGDSQALEEVRQFNEQLVAIADKIADLGDATGSQFGLFDHFANLAADPRFQMIDGQYVESEAAMMRRVQAVFDEMIAEGTDISMEAMDQMLKEMSEGQRGSLKFKKGSAAEDLFGTPPED